MHVEVRVIMTPVGSKGPMRCGEMALEWGTVERFRQDKWASSLASLIVQGSATS